ncbi:unnamed protein product [Phyllotreta striolata]|uniref:EF-hand domain-containing protein n=1 Tax=Phyllotreta striolata TaxID=444603 RepID=A0A9N9XP20_PHYSR|nr:unnamed protein product [Phyllotreta striolata]
MEAPIEKIVYQPQEFLPPAPQTINPAIQKWFQTVDRDRSGEINWEELQSALVNAQGEHFSSIACKMMISMFDADRTGTITINEFQQLYTYINQWLVVFKNYDRNGSGSIEEMELAQALQQMGFRFSNDFVKFLINRSDFKTHSKISVDQFIVICVQIQKFTEAFKARDTHFRGSITVGFEEFIKIAIDSFP